MKQKLLKLDETSFFVVVDNWKCSVLFWYLFLLKSLLLLIIFLLNQKGTFNQTKMNIGLISLVTKVIVRIQMLLSNFIIYNEIVFIISKTLVIFVSIY